MSAGVMPLNPPFPNTDSMVVRSSGVQRSSACSTASVALPSRRSLATGLPRTSSDAVRSSTSSTIWKRHSEVAPVVGQPLLVSIAGAARIPPNFMQTENRQAVLR